jgi:hypothetical protein
MTVTAAPAHSTQLSTANGDRNTNDVPRDTPATGVLDGRRVTTVTQPASQAVVGPGLVVIALVELFITAIASLAVGFLHDSWRDGLVVAAFGIACTLLTGLFVNTLHPTF